MQLRRLAKQIFVIALTAGILLISGGEAYAQTQPGELLAPGLEHVTFVDGGVNVVNVARLAAGAQLSLKAVPAQGGLERTSAACKRLPECLVAVNGDFHNETTGEPIGGVVADRVQVAKAAFIEQQLSLDGSGCFSTSLLAIPSSAEQSLGSSYTILEKGKPKAIDEQSGYTNGLHARTLIGWDEVCNKFLVTVDQGDGYSQGMTLAKAADLMLRLGATEAVAEDGGSSTTFAVGGQLKNRPVAGERAVANMWMVVSTPPPVNLGVAKSSLFSSSDRPELAAKALQALPRTKQRSKYGLVIGVILSLDAPPESGLAMAGVIGLITANLIGALKVRQKITARR